jgi:aspartate kinase
MRGPWHAACGVPPAGACACRPPRACAGWGEGRTRPSPPNLPLVAEIVVMKFGGTSVADAERIKRAARRIVERREQGFQVVAVLSARGKTTDELIAMAEEISADPDPREMDMLLSTGERISCALCAMAIHDLGHRAISLTGSQAGIVTDTWHTQARIIDVRGDRVREALAEDRIVLVAGFQGVSTASADVTTLGRGGSDTTAVAVAAAVGAGECEIYTDVAGVFSADPRIVPDVRMLPYVSFEEMLELSAAGAGVLQLRSVEYARKHGVRIHCRSSFDNRPGTLVVSEGEMMSKFGEQALVTGVAYSTAESMITLHGVRDEPGVAARLFEALTEANVKVDMIDQSGASAGESKARIRLTVPHEDLKPATAALEPMSGELYEQIVIEPEMGKVSIVGAGMRTEPGVAAKVFRVLADEQININMISTSPVRISCMLLRERVEAAVQALHDAFELSGRDTIAQEDPFAAGGL